MPTAEQFTLDFCDRWIAKAYESDDRLVYGAFDKYFTLYVCFNRLYNQIGETAGRRETDDSKLATSVFADVVGRDVIWATLGTLDGDRDLCCVSDLIGPGGQFNIHFNRHTRQPDPAKDTALKHSLVAALPAQRVDATLSLLYQVRCNLVHGRKAVDIEQLQLLQPCTQSLRRVIAAGRGWLADAT